MNESQPFVEYDARQRREQHLARSARPILPPLPHRHRWAIRLRTAADRLEG